MEKRGEDIAKSILEDDQSRRRKNVIDVTIRKRKKTSRCWLSFKRVAFKRESNRACRMQEMWTNV